MKKNKAIFTIWCTENYHNEIGISGLIKSLKHFHPNIPVQIVTTTPAEAGPIYEKYPVMMKPYSTLKFFDDYELVVHMDSDCTITGALDEIFTNNYDVACVRNFTHNGSCGRDSSEVVKILGVPLGLTTDTFMNAGFVAIRSKQFLEDWLDGLYKLTWDGDDQNELNRIINSGKYKVKVLDDHGMGVTYGVSNCWGNTSHWDSWKNLYLDNDQLYIDNQNGEKLKVKILHVAGGKPARESVFLGKMHREWLLDWVSDDVKEFLLKITN